MVISEEMVLLRGQNGRIGRKKNEKVRAYSNVGVQGASYEIIDMHYSKTT